MEQFTITKKSKDADRGVYFEKVEGERVKLGVHECFVFEEQGEEGIQFNVSHVETGFHIYIHKHKKVATALAEIKLLNYPENIEKGRELCRSLNVKLPVNT